MERITGKLKRLTGKFDGKRFTAKLMSAVLIASTALNAFAPAAAYAAEPEKATVTLTETEHGQLSFDGTESKTLTVDVGSTVTVSVSPDEGYFADSITVFNEDEEGEAVDVKDGKATFPVNGDTIATATFYENGSAGSAALMSADVDEGKSVKDVESYIRDHADKKHVGSEGELRRADVLTVTTTVVDGGKLPEGTLDALWADDDGDGMSDHWDAMLSQAVSHAVLFELDPDSDYYVGWAGADISGAKLTDWGASENNADAQMRDGFLVDDATGLVYVPKSYTELNAEGKPMVASSRIQLVYTTSEPAATVTFDFNSTATDVRGDVASKGKTSVPVTAATTKVTLATDDEALDSVTGRTIDSVTVNGIEYTPDMGMWEYDAETGSLEFAMAPAGIHAMSVKMSSNFGKDVANFFRMPEPRMSVNNIGTWEFKSAPWVGQTFRTQGRNRYSSNSSGRHLPAVENPSGGNYESKTINQAMGWQPVDLSKLKAGYNTILRTADIWVQDTGTVKIPTQANLALTCGHVGVDNNFNYNPGYNEDALEEDTLGQHIRIFSVSGGKAIIGVTVPTNHTQAGAGFFEISWKVTNGKLNLKKVSANPSITDGNDCYSLAGAEFTVYNGANAPVGTLTTDASGNSNTIELPEGTYTVRETKAPEGFRKAPDQTVTVHSQQTATVTFSDMPAGDPMRMAVGKFDGDKEYTDSNLPQGSASLAGAEFTIEYYDTLKYGDYDALKKAGEKPTRSWVVRTNEKGRADLSESSLVSGDDFYYTESGNITLPRGSVAVYESKAPAGYKLNSQVSFQKIQENPLETVITFNPPEVPESVYRGGVSVQKLDSETGQTPQGDADFSGIRFAIINDNENDVVVDGQSYAKGKTVKTITTDAKGVAKTADDALPYGKYIIRESATNDGYLNTAEDMHVTVSEDGKIYAFNAKDDIVRGGVKITKHDIENGTSDPIGAASIDGTQFEVKSLNEHPVIADGVTYNKGQVITTLTIKDGEASTANDLLPYGLYSIQEVKSGEGYLLTDGKAHEFRIEKNGELVNPINGSFENQVMRSDLEFTKKGDDGSDRLAGIAFKVTSKTTGESHVAVTDENGYFSSASSWNKHTQNTNGNDWALDADGVIDSDELDATAGIWFGGTEPDDSKGALPYDTYSIEELRCTANEGYQLVETTVIISRNGKVYDFGTLTDVKASITTKAFDPQDGDSLVGMGYVYIADKVNYSNLIPGRDYKLVAELHDASTGDILTDENGEDIVTEQTFTASEPTGFEYVDFQLSTYDLGGKTVTVYEKLYDDSNSLIAKHTDKDDVNQQVSVVVPEIGTVAVDGADGDKNVSTDDEATVIDTVAYKNLVPGKKYLVFGQLFEKKTGEDGETTGEPLEVDGKPVIGYAIFTPESTNGTVDVTFTFDSLALKDDTQLVVYETLFGYDKPMSADAISKMVPLFDVDRPSTPEYPLLAEHADINDLGQTVTIRNPHITTTALDGVDMNKNVVTDDESIIIDTVSYENLVPGKKYTLKGSVQVKKTDKDGKVTAKPLEVDGKPVKAETTFTPEKSEGTANVTFQFSSRDLKPGTELVVFESLERDGNVLVTHDSIEDVNQTVTVIVPSIATTALDGTDADKNVVTDDESVIVDTVEYKNLVPGKEYVAKGQLYLKDTGEPLEVDGKPVKAETTFTPEEADGTVDVTFTFDSRTIEDKSDLVVFESLERCGTEIASHKDIEDDKQTVTVTHPEIGTSAVDGSDGDRNVIVDDTTEVIDTVEYTGLIPGKEYTVKGTLHVKVTDGEGKVTDEVLKVDGKPVTAETTFTPEKADGKVDVTFIFDSRTIPHDTEIVAFESLERNGVEIAAHADIEDKSQTVTAKHPFITTSALDGHDSDKNVVTDAETTVIDTVKYSGLIPGKEYTMKGSMQVKKTGEDGKATAEPLEVDGKPVKAETTFTPDTADGKVDVTFTFDSSAVDDKTDLVVFESLERGGVSIAEHKDIEDEKQTTTTRVTGISTTATDELDGDKTVIADADTTITDDVAYENALTGIDYTMAGILMDADTGLPILTGDGSEKYTENDVAKFMQKLLDVLGIASTNEGGKDYLDVPVSQNTADGVTKSQSVRVHVDGTYEVVTSENGMDGDGLGYANVDTSGSIGYDKLTDEQKAAISNVAVLPEAGIILDYTGADNLPADIDTDALDQLIADNSDLISHLVFQKAEFTPDKYDGTVPMDFHFNANDVIDRIGGETKDIVVFEVMFKGTFDDGSTPAIVASECDLDSEEQTVKLVPTVIGTTATDKSDGDHTLMAGKDAVITDHVEYEGLVPGREYTLKATLMDKETGEPLSVADQHVTAELKFTPNSQSGSVDIDLGKFDASDLDGHDLVVFEELYKQHTEGDETTDVLVAEHKDINDEGQTVTVTTTPPGGFFGKTGGNVYPVVIAVAALVVLAGGCAYYGIKNRKGSDGDAGSGSNEGDDGEGKPEA